MSLRRDISEENLVFWNKKLKIIYSTKRKRTLELKKYKFFIYEQIKNDFIRLKVK